MTPLVDPIAYEIWLMYESWNLISQEHLHPCKTKNLQIFYICMPKIKLIDQFLLEIKLIQEFRKFRDFLKFTSHFLHFLNLYLHTKRWIDSSIFSWDIANLIILQSDSLRAFLAMSTVKLIQHLSHFLNLYLNMENQVES